MKIRDVTHDINGTLFDIPLDCLACELLRLREIKLKTATPYDYDIFIGAWGVFSHHDQLPLNIAKHIYVYFVLEMHLN